MATEEAFSVGDYGTIGRMPRVTSTEVLSSGNTGELIRVWSVDAGLDRGQVMPPPDADAPRPTEKHGVRWSDIASAMVCNVCGLGLITLPSVVARLGWLLGILGLVLFLPLNIFTSLLLWRAREVFPAAVSLNDLAFFASGPKLQAATDFVVCFTVFLIMAVYYVFTAHVLRMLFYDTALTPDRWSALAFVVLLPVAQLRTLGELRWLINADSVVIALVVVVTTWAIWRRPHAGTTTALVARDLDVWSFFAAFASMAFAYGGQIMQLEMMHQMQDPREFPRAIAAAAPFQLVVYLVVACLGYAALGASVSAELLDEIPCSPVLRVAAACMLFHLIISFSLLSVMLTRKLCITLGYRHEARMPWLTWFGVSTSLSLACLAVVIVVPLFGDLVAFVGAVGASTTSYFLPPLLFRRALAFRNEREKRTATSLSPAFSVLLFATSAFGLVVMVLGAGAALRSMYLKLHGASDVDTPWAGVGGGSGGNRSSNTFVPRIYATTHVARSWAEAGRC